MPKLYIANGTRQTVNFQYRLPGVVGLRSQFIPPGKQLLISGDLSTQDIAYIVESNEKYGLTDCTKIDQTKPFIGMCYSIDKPVPPPKLMKVLEHNIDVLTERGHENREMAAIATNQAIENQLEQTQVGELGAMEMEIIEERKPGQGSSRKQIAEGMRVTRREGETARQDGRQRSGAGGGQGKGKGGKRARG